MADLTGLPFSVFSVDFEPHLRHSKAPYLFIKCLSTDARINFLIKPVAESWESAKLIHLQVSITPRIERMFRMGMVLVESTGVSGFLGSLKSAIENCSSRST